jgi:GNAT superfamily N-acetyltransferase
VSTLTFETRHGADIAARFEPLARLRMAVFRDFPYLYEGSAEYEQTYLEPYACSERSLLVAVYDGPEMVGATTALPLTDELPELRAPFGPAGYDAAEFFYFGESLLLPAYRGRGLGHRFFDEREAHARRWGTYAYTCFCAVVRPADHPARPAGYRPHDAFWRKRGYRPEPRLQSTLDWPDLGQTDSTPKTMQYWLRPLRA